MGPECGRRCARAGLGAGWCDPHPGHHRARGWGEDCGESWKTVRGGVQAAVRHQPGGDPRAQDQNDGGAVSVEDADLPGPETQASKETQGKQMGNTGVIGNT